MYISSLRQVPGSQSLLRWLSNPYVLLAVTALSVWLLDGFGIGPVNDGWTDLGLKIQHSSLVRGGRTIRILGLLPKALGTRIVDDGFQGWQSMLLILTFLRAALFYDIVRRLLPRERLFALACGLIALFHPADDAWFWMDATGAHLGFVFALAGCWASLAWLQGGRAAWFAAAALFQCASALTYSGYQPLIFAFCVGAWVLLWLQQCKPSWQRLAGVLSFAFLSILLQLVSTAQGVGREGRVADFQLQGALAGYASELQLFLSSSAGIFSGFWLGYLIYAIVPAILVLCVCLIPRQPEPGAEAPPRPSFHLAMLLGLIGLAAVSYLPYAVSDVRFGNRRQLMAAGIFLYAACAYLVFVLLPPALARLPRTRAWLFPLLLSLLAAVTVVVGLEKRAVFVSDYRAEEKLLSAIAKQLPHPHPGTTILVRLHERWQISTVWGFTNRPVTFETALQAMYTDDSLQANFLPAAADPSNLEFGPDKLGYAARIGNNARLLEHVQVPYGQVIVVDYLKDSSTRILDSNWLQQQAGKVDVSAYKPEAAFDSQPAPAAIICTMLEEGFRPDYCTPKK